MEEFNVLEFLKYYFSKFVFVILFIFIGFVASYIYTEFMQTAIYRSQASLVLNSTGSTLTQSDVNLNKNLVSTYREIVKSRRILNTVIEELKLDITYDELKKQVEVTSVNDTELILISVYNEDSQLAKEIADKIAKTFKVEVTEIYNIENVSIIDEALVSDIPYNVHILKQYIIGMGIGFGIISLILAIKFYMDDTVKSEEDIENKLKLPVLGMVPKYKEKKNK